MISCLFAACGGSEDSMSTGLEFAATPEKAKEQIDKGYNVVMSVGFLTDGYKLLSNAESILEDSIKNYPNLYQSQRLKIAIADELFWVNGQVAKDKKERFDKVLEVKELIRKRLPDIEIGIDFNPEVWYNDSEVWQYILESQHHVDWLAINIYFWNFSQVDQKLGDALKFRRRVSKPTILVVQGFAPLDCTFDDDCHFKYNEAMRKLNLISKTYNHALIWSWNGPKENEEKLVFGEHFPNRFKEIYARWKQSGQ